jgi:hypothetical protein
MEKSNQAPDTTAAPPYGTYLLTQPSLARKVACAVYGLLHGHGLADDLMWPLRKQPRPEAGAPCTAPVHRLRAFNEDGTEVPTRVRPLPGWAAELPCYTNADVPLAAQRLLSDVLRELVKALPEDACKRIWDAQVDPLNLDPGDAVLMAGYAYLPATVPDGQR